MSDVTNGDVSVNAWLDAAARKQPAPGGGSVAALVGALAAAMGEMTLNFTVGKKANPPELEARVAAELGELNRARTLLLRLMVEDQTAFAALTAARKLDDSVPQKQEQIDLAAAASVAVPQAVMAAGLRVLAAANRVSADANRWLLSDLEVCGELALATVRCGRYNVRANLTDLDPGEATRLAAECDAAVVRGVVMLRTLLADVDERRGLWGCPFSRVAT